MTHHTSTFRVVAQLAWPNLASERTFIRAEQQYVARQVARLASASVGVRLLHWLERAPTARAWRRYDQSLHRYGNQLDRHEQELAQGLTPLVITVLNKGQQTARRIDIMVAVEHGEVHPHKKMPRRPTMIDRDEHIQWSRLVLTGGFWRSHIRVTAHRLGAQFSRLRSGEEAYLFYDTVFIEGDVATKLTYQVRSGNIHEQGEVLVAE